MSIRALVISAALALAACSPPQQQANTAPNGKPGDAGATAQTPAPAPVADASKPDASAAIQPANPITPQFLVGRWGDNGDCSKDVVFNADGSFHSYTGLDGRWDLNGDTITMSGARDAFTLQMQYIDENHLMLRNPDGSIGTSQRC